MAFDHIRFDNIADKYELTNRERTLATHAIVVPYSCAYLSSKVSDEERLRRIEATVNEYNQIPSYDPCPRY